jgi:hypothetical protein
MELTKVVGRPSPRGVAGFDATGNRTTVPGAGLSPNVGAMKPDPFTVSVNPTLPATTVVGLIEVTTGSGTMT